ncbi:MAG: hypothetical protein ACKVS8_07485 [Phycisphaerales bacterium]
MTAVPSALSGSQPVRVEAVACAGPCRAAVAAELMLAQCQCVIDSLSDAAYVAPSTVLPGGTVGKHVRHVLDHFAAALLALDHPDTVIDYDHRERGTDVEGSRAAARSAIAAAREGLLRVDIRTGAARVRVLVMLASDGACDTLESTLAREVAFAAHHGVHHYAMIGAIARELGVSPPEAFGKAPSTLNAESITG